LIDAMQPPSATEAAQRRKTAAFENRAVLTVLPCFPRA
jgi:hypothetical protein